jgi:hypothetical protein
MAGFDSYLLQSVQTGPVAHQGSYRVVRREYFHRVKRPEREAHLGPNFEPIFPLLTLISVKDNNILPQISQTMGFPAAAGIILHWDIPLFRSSAYVMYLLLQFHGVQCSIPDEVIGFLN